MENLSKPSQALISKILYPYAVEFAKRGNYTQAEESLRFILTQGLSPEHLLLLGKVYAQQGKYNEAIAEWEKALELNPENQEAKEAIKKAQELMGVVSLPPSHFFKQKLRLGLLVAVIVASVGVNFWLWQDKKTFEHEMAKMTQDYQLRLRDKGTDLGKAIKERLNSDERLAWFNIKITNKKGQVWCYGEVPTWHLKELTGRVIRSMEGVESVDTNGIVVTHYYDVSSGDTLIDIATRLYGDANKWQDIFEANPIKIKEPDVIKPGVFLYIP